MDTVKKPRKDSARPKLVDLIPNSSEVTLKHSGTILDNRGQFGIENYLNRIYDTVYHSSLGDRFLTHSLALGSGIMSLSIVMFRGLPLPSGNLNSNCNRRIAKVSFISLDA